MQDLQELARAWLDMHCRLAPGVSRAAVFLGSPDRGPFAAVARWPQGSELAGNLADAAEAAMLDRRGVVRAPQEIPAPQEIGEGARDAVALPVVIDGALWGSVACEVPHRPKAQQEAVVERLLTSCAWLELLLRQNLLRRDLLRRDPLDRSPLGRNDSGGTARVVTVLELVSVCLEPAGFQAAATALATELASRLSLERVSLGFRPRDHVELRALSHSAQFGEKANLSRLIEAAMDEALDQQATLVHPPLPNAPAQATRAHQALAREQDGGACCSIPFGDDGDGGPVGALTLECSEGTLAPETVELCSFVASLAGPILEIRRRDDRWLAAKAADSVRHFVAELFGPSRAILKLCASLAVTGLLLLGFVKGSYRVAAEATLEGTMRRVVVAAMDGFVVEEHARAGDVVRAGQVLAVLDDRDLRLERLRWVSERDQFRTEYREAQALGHWAQVSILSAQIAQADAQLALVDEQLARTRLEAPFDGIIVQGDLSQSLGSPVERGEVFFEIAPLDSYRIILEIDERDIGALAPGQEGWLALSSMPGQRLALVVERITPMASADEGRNFFRVEASLEEPPDRLRPGMEGVAKIEIDRRSLLWIFGHEVVDWLRLWAWAWWP